ncbi:hypothetical protein BJ741DRAFT_600882 [Chytriomyces cf. hyalinus JEL632]|nr:hypothetical protein BJ741DRAFT_600882 [Chytriomyces cf. hyalinus JEL632]
MDAPNQNALVERITTLSNLLHQNQQQVLHLQDSTAVLKVQLEAAREQALENEATGCSDTGSRIIELQRENKILNNLIKQYEASIEAIMIKFRLQTDLVQKRKHSMQREADAELAKEKAVNDELRRENILLAAKLNESVNVIRLALVAHDNDDDDDERDAGLRGASLLHSPPEENKS